MKFIRKYIYTGTVSAWSIGCLILLILQRINGKKILLTGTQLAPFDLLFILTVMLCIGAGSLLIRLRRRAARTAVKVLIVSGWIAIGGICLIGSCLAILNHGITSYYEFKSPDKQHRLVAEETTFLLLSSIRLYERENPFFIRDLDQLILPDDGYPSITAGDYEITWNGAKVTLAASLNNNGRWTSLTLDMEQDGKLIDEQIYNPHETPAYTDGDTLSDTDGSRNTDGTGDTDSLSDSDDSDDTDSLSGTDSPSGMDRAVQTEQAISPEDARIHDGLYAVAEAIREAGGTGSTDTGKPSSSKTERITYTAKGTPRLIIPGDRYLLYDRDSANEKCALYVLYAAAPDSADHTESQIVDMYAYEYDSGNVIRSGKHDWSDTGTPEYQKATGE